MKKFLRWLFEERMVALEEESFWEGVNRDRRERKNFVAERFLESLGYEIKYDSGVREQPSETTNASLMGYRLVKKEKPILPTTTQ